MFILSNLFTDTGTIENNNSLKWGNSVYLANFALLKIGRNFKGFYLVCTEWHLNKQTASLTFFNSSIETDLSPTISSGPGTSGEEAAISIWVCSMDDQ